jgi:hypothetical protein
MVNFAFPDIVVSWQGEQFQYDEDSEPHQNMVVRLSLLE